ncbi:Fc receptor-like protein 5 [Lithobates pipiens]
MAKRSDYDNATILGHTGWAVNPVVTFTPNWRKIFTEESIKMTCDVGITEGRSLTYYWYKDGKRIHTGKIFTIGSADTEDTGDYRCQAGTERSGTARLDVVTDPLILRVPLYVHEGDDLTLRCHHRSGFKSTFITFYKENSTIHDQRYTSVLHVETVNVTDSGRYKCTDNHPLYTYVNLQDDVIIYIQKLYEIPKIKVTPYPVVEGDEMTLTCDTRLNPLRPRTQLKLAFHKDGRNVREFTYGNQYGVQSAQVKDSGKYSCEVTTATNSVKKRSQEILVEINALYEIPKIKVTSYPVVEGDEMTLTCNTSLSPLRLKTQLKFAFQKDGRNVREFTSYNQYGVQSAQVKDSGNYSCEVTTATNSVKKRSPEILVKINALYEIPKIKVTPYPVVEGDEMTLTCNTSLSPLRPRTQLKFAFHKDGRNVRELFSNNQYGVQSTQVKDSGNYSCDVTTATNSVKKRSPEILVEINELYEIPKIKVTPYPVAEGDEMTLTCDTSLSPLRPRTQLKFAFHKDGRNVREFTSNNQYGVQSAQVKDSGNYSCEVTTTTNSVKKRHQEILVEINELFMNPRIIGIQYHTIEGDQMILVCNTSLSPLRQRTELWFAFYRDGRNVQLFSLSDQYGVQSAQLEDSGNYSCDVRALNGKVIKSSHLIPITIKELFFTPVLNVSTIKVLEEINLTLTCDTHLSPFRQRTELHFAFYRDGQNIQEFSLFYQYGIRSARLEDSGNYSCKVRSASNISKKSEDVFVQIEELLEIPEIKVTSYLVVEGDEMTLTCNTSLSPLRPRTQLKLAFHKDGRNVREFTSYNQYGVQSAQVKDSGNYSCDVTTTTNSVKKRSPERLVEINELFEIPEIKVTPSPVVEGDEMTLTCDTSLSPLRPRTQLKFAFHKDGWNVQGFNSYNQYGVQSAQVKDSGKYSCEVTTATYSVRKRSPEKLVEINELFRNTRIRAIPYPAVEGDQIVLRCYTSYSPLRQRTELEFAFYRDGRNVQEFSSSDQYGVQSAQLEDSGNYSCDVKASNVKVRKSSIFIHIMIKELFSTPVLNVSAIKVLEGDAMNITCNTSLSPLRQRTELQFAFYRDGRNVQEFSLSDQYGVQSAQLEDSGNYSCEVRSASNISSNISKKSEDAFVQIREKSGKHTTTIIIVALLVLLLVVIFLLFKYRHKLHWPTIGCSHQQRGLQPKPQISSTYAVEESVNDTEVTYTNLILHCGPQVPKYME